MRKRSLVALTAGLVTAVLLTLGAVVVVAAPDTDIPLSVFGSGGDSSSSTNFDLGSTAAQSAIGPAQSTNYVLGAGYWYGVALCTTGTDTDSDGARDPCDPDDDNDSLGLGDPFGLFLRDGVEVFMGTLPLVACAATSTIDDEDPDALGPDWDDDQDVDGSDLFLFAQRFGTDFGVPPPVGKLAYLERFDIYPTAASLNKIDGSDLFVLASYFGDSCP